MRKALTPSEAAELLSVGVETIRRAIKGKVHTRWKPLGEIPAEDCKNEMPRL